MQARGSTSRLRGGLLERPGGGMFGGTVPDSTGSGTTLAAGSRRARRHEDTSRRQEAGRMRSAFVAVAGLTVVAAFTAGLEARPGPRRPLLAELGNGGSARAAVDPHAALPDRAARA